MRFSLALVSLCAVFTLAQAADPAPSNANAEVDVTNNKSGSAGSAGSSNNGKNWNSGSGAGNNNNSNNNNNSGSGSQPSWYQRYKGGNERWWQQGESNWYSYQHDVHQDSYYDDDDSGSTRNTNRRRYWYSNTGNTGNTANTANTTQSANATQAINSTTAWGLLKGDVIVIHGFGGSRLVKTSDNSTVWITENILRNVETPDIKLGLKRERGEPDGIMAAGFMTSETWNPFYGEFLDKLRGLDTAGQIKLNLFAYDWRRDNVYTSTLFQAYITRIYNGNGGKPVTIFAHSMGGLITLHTYHSFDPKSRDMIRGIVFAGSMFNGSPYGITQMLTGGVEGENASILNADSVFLTRSAWSFQCFDDGCMQTQGGTIMKLDLYDPDNWVKYKLAAALDPYYNTTVGTYDERVSFAKTQLSYARQIRDAQYPRTSVYYPPMVTLCSRALDTASRMIISPNATGLNINVDNYIQSKGDGVVTWASCQMQQGMPSQMVETTKDHFRLLNDFDAVGEAIAYIFGY